MIGEVDKQTGRNKDNTEPHKKKCDIIKKGKYKVDDVMDKNRER